MLASGAYNVTQDSNNSSTYLSALRQIDSIPVPDLASTLHLSSHSSAYRDEADEANDANISFLRTHLDPQEEWRAQNADAWEELQHRQRERERERQRRRDRGDAASTASSTGAMVAGQGNGGEDRARRERLQRVLNRLNRMHSPSGPWLTESMRARMQAAMGGGESTYGERIPSENSLYDWSPMGDLQRELDREPQRQEEADVDDELRVERDIERATMLIYTELRRDQPNTHLDVLRATARARAREQIETEREAARRRAYSSILSMHNSNNHAAMSSAYNASANEPPLRNQALLQSVRRHPRFPQRSREYMQRYVIDRERYQYDSDERDRWQEQRARWSGNDGNWPHSPLRNTDSDGHDLSRMAWQNHSTSSVDRQSSERRTVYRRNYLENPSRHRPTDRTPEPSEWLQKTITYLAQLRDCADYEEALSRAVDADFLTKEFMGEKQDDFLFDIDDVPRPQETSWLAPGAVFAGSQHATSAYSLIRQADNESQTNSNTSNVPPHVWQSMTSAERRRAGHHQEARRSASMQRILDRANAMVAPDPPEQQHQQQQQPQEQRQQPQHSQRASNAPDRWPVKVTIHAVDWERMTIAATMEAYNVPHQNSSYSSIISAANASAHTHNVNPDTDMPDASSPHPPIQPKSSSITTYLEGEIIDLAQHTLLTESYPSDKRNDAVYWRKLEPFSHLAHDDDMTRNLVSKRALEDLNSKYILMRWKERCFIPASSTSTLSTSTAHTVNTASRNDVWDGARPWMHQGDAVMAETGEGCGLTISGFYYVCLRREDGGIEGLYCDPDSSPYQHLKLGRVGGGVFPTWSFT